MANLVGQIKGYHSGVKHLANIYDVKQSTIGAANVLMHFDSSPTRDECGNTWNDYGSQKFLALNGTNYLQTTNITLGGQDFTIDFWGYMSSASGNWSRFFSIFDNTNTTGNRIWVTRSATTNNLIFNVNDKASCHFTDAWKDRFNHYAIVYQHSASTVAFYVNGQLIGSGSCAIEAHTFKFCWIGRSEYTADANLTGFIDDFRISSGVARWTANFTPPARGSISKDANTTVLLKFDTDTTTDECGNTWTAYGSPYLSSSVVTVAQSKFGKALALDGTNYLQMSQPITLGGQDFTIDFWFNVWGNSTGGTACFVSFMVDGNNRLHVGYISNDGLQIWSATGEVVVETSPIRDGLWHHCAAVYVHSIAKYYIFVDGVLKASQVGRQYSARTAPLYIGTNPATGRKITGFIDELRFINGKAMWIADFTPPTSAYTTTTGASTVNANMMIRHNNANCYIPLTTNAAHTTAPYIAIRHGNANYYTVK